MKSESVRDPDGRLWRVSVRMLPWRPRFRWPWNPWRERRRQKDALADGSLEAAGIDALFFDEIFLVLLVVLVALAILPTFLFFIEVLILAVMVVMTALVRVLFRQPWIVDATADDGTRKAWKVTGYRASRRAVPEIAAQLARGTETPIARGAALVR